MEMEFKDGSRRRKLLIVVGVLLAIVAGGGAFVMSSQGAGQVQAEVPTRSVLVAVRDIPARTVIESGQLTLRDLPEDAVVAQAMTDPQQAVGLLTGVTIYANQPVTPNLLATSNANAEFSILSPTETVSPNSPTWRAASVIVPKERAVAGMVLVGQRVDLIATVQIDVLNIQDDGSYAAGPSEEGFVTGKTTKLVFADIEVLAKEEDSDLYVLKVDLHQAEEIAHLQAGAAGTFSIALRPDGDSRYVTRSEYGETTDRIVWEYGHPAPRLIDLEGVDAELPVRIPDPTPSAAPAEASPSPQP